MCQALIDGIRNGTISIVSDGSFNPAFPIWPVWTSTVILAPSIEKALLKRAQQKSHEKSRKITQIQEIPKLE